MEERAKAAIAKKGGTVIGEAYRDGVGRRLPVRCDKGHEWSPFINDLVCRNSWCKICVINARKSDFEELRRLMAERGGTLLSEEKDYENNKTPLLVECDTCKNKWKIRANNFKMGQWCPNCKIHTGEEMVRASLQELFPGKKFNRTRSLPWLHGLELDGYEEELSLAFEYQGRQHYEYVPHFHRRKGDFEAQQERDRRKAELCDDKWVMLLVVPHRFEGRDLKDDDLREFVRREIYLLGYTIPSTKADSTTFSNTVRVNATQNQDRMRTLNEILAPHGARCESRTISSVTAPLDIVCAKGHRFKQALRDLLSAKKRGQAFCPICNGYVLSEDKIKGEVEARGYKFVCTYSMRKTATARKFRYIMLVCELHGEQEISVTNFRAGPRLGDLTRGCAACGNSRSGKPKK